MIKQHSICALYSLLFSSWVYAAQPGDSAPDCSAGVFDGNKMLTLAEHQNKVIYVDFWASWCPPCRRSFPSLNRLHNELKDQGFEVIAINLDETKSDAVEFLQHNPVNFSVAYDGEGKCPNAFQVMAMPSSYIIDKKGIVREVHLGFDEDNLRSIRSTVLTLLSE